MSRAIKLAEKYFATGVQPSKAQLDKLTPSEQHIFMLAAADGRITKEMRAQAARNDLGGLWLSNEEARSQHRAALASLPPTEQFASRTTHMDDVSGAHVSTAALEDLEEATLDELTVGEINYGKVLRLTIADRVAPMIGAIMLVEDTKGRLVPCALYCCTPADATRADVWDRFPKGARLILKEPYLKVSTSGFVNLRVDHPCNVIVEKAAATAAAAGSGAGKGKGSKLVAAAAAAATPAADAAAATGSLSPSALKDVGNTHFTAGQYGAALVHYSRALEALATAAAAPAAAAAAAASAPAAADGASAPAAEPAAAGATSATASAPGAATDAAGADAAATAALRLALYKNRAAAHLYLNDPAAALADTEAALAIDPLDAKAAFRRHTALRRLCRFEDAFDAIDRLCKGLPAVLTAMTAGAGATTTVGGGATGGDGTAGSAATGGAAASDVAAAVGGSSASSADAAASSTAAPAGKVDPEFASARAAAAVALDQFRGKFNFLTLPWTPKKQEEGEGVVAYYGPIEIQDRPKQGWTLVAARDIPAGTLLFAEPAMACAVEPPRARTVMFDGASGGGAWDGAMHQLRWELVYRSNESAHVRAQLALLKHQTEKQHGAGLGAPPTMEQIRRGLLAPRKAPVSYKRCAGAVNINSFSFTISDHAPPAMRAAMERVVSAVHDRVNMMPEVRDPKPATLIMGAINNKATTPASLQALIRMTPPELNSTDDRGRTALHYAIMMRKPDLATVLVAEGCDVNVADVLGMTPLHYACSQFQSLPVMDLLIAHKADINAVTARGFTPLHCAVSQNRAAAVDKLLAAKADPFIAEAMWGQSPVDIAYAPTNRVPDVLAAFEKHKIEPTRAGAALWFVASFMHHSPRPSCGRAYVGKVMFARALHALKAGDPITTSFYESDVSDDAKERWGIKE